MYSECLPFTRVPHTSRLFIDYLYHFDRVSGFYPHPPLSTEWLPTQAAAIKYDESRRHRVADLLQRQNQKWGSGKRTFQHIERLRHGAYAVVTGQQVALFGGPLFALLKAVTAARIALEATSAGVEAVPIFWLATEDHDLAEVNHATLPGPDGLQTVATASRGVPDSPVSSVVLDGDIGAAVNAAAELLGDSEAAEWIRAAYEPGGTLGDGFAQLFARLFDRFGIILLDPADVELHELAKPVFKRAVEEASEIGDDLLARGKALRGADYHEQVKVTFASTLLFAIEQGARIPIHRRNGEFEIAGRLVSRSELITRVDSNPEQFSANVLLRPVMQDYLLPTLTYIGGPAEIAYFAQSAVVYERLLGRVTPVRPRLSATIVEPANKRLLDKYGLKVTDLFNGPEATRDLIAKRVLPEDLRMAFDYADANVKQSITQVLESLARLDPTLVDAARRSTAKMTYQLSKLRTKAANAELRRSEILSRHAEQLSTALYPGKGLQERSVAGVYFVARHGTDLLDSLYETAHPGCPDHQIVYL